MDWEEGCEECCCVLSRYLHFNSIHAQQLNQTGGGFALAAVTGHFSFYATLIETLNANGHDIALFFLAYDLTPSAAYPTQLRQSVAALRYILSSRDPGNVLIGGDSAGGNLALAVLLHLSRPHPQIEPLEIDAPLAGVFAFAPWVSFRGDWPSLEGNRYKDVIPKEALAEWSAAYLGGKGKEGDAWSEPYTAPTEWWGDAARKTRQVLILAGEDEILFSAIDEFVQRFKVCFLSTFWVGLEMLTV